MGSYGNRLFGSEVVCDCRNDISLEARLNRQRSSPLADSDHPRRSLRKLKSFNHRLLSTPQLQEDFQASNMKMDSKLVQVAGKLLPMEKLIFEEDSHVEVGEDGDWAEAFK